MAELQEKPQVSGNCLASWMRSQLRPSLRIVGWRGARRRRIGTETLEPACRQIRSHHVTTRGTWCLPPRVYRVRGWSGRREAPGAARLVPTGAGFLPPPIDPCMRFSRTRLTDVLHRRHSAPGRYGRFGRGAAMVPLRLISP